MTGYIRDMIGHLNAQRGQTLAEHGLILAFVAMACVVLVGVLGLIVAGHIDSLSIAFP